MCKIEKKSLSQFLREINSFSNTLTQGRPGSFGDSEIATMLSQKLREINVFTKKYLLGSSEFLFSHCAQKTKNIKKSTFWQKIFSQLIWRKNLRDREFIVLSL